MKLSDLSGSRRQIFASYDKNEEDVQEDIRILREWMLKLPHLPSESIQDHYLELCLLKNKFSIEKCKSKIENYCSSKADPHFKYVYETIPVPGKEASTYTPLPVLTDEYKRVIIYKIHNEKIYDVAKDLTLNTTVREFLLRYDYNDGEIFIADLRNCSTSIITKIRINLVADFMDLILRGYSARISAMHVISKIGKLLFSTIIPFMPKKLTSRVHFHEDADSLKNIIPSKCLPSDYGGTLKSLNEIIADWDDILAENQKLVQTFIDTKSLEELRIGDKQDTGEMEGTFKKLNID